MKDKDLIPSMRIAIAVLQQLDMPLNSIEIEVLPGSYSNYTHLVSGLDAAGDKQRIVIRRYKVFGDYDRGAKAQREFETFQALQRHGLPGPEALLLDKNGSLLEIPGIVCQYVQGSQLTAPPDPVAWAAELGTMLARIHAIPCDEFSPGILLDGNPELTWFLRKDGVPEEMLAHHQGERVWQAVNDLYQPENLAPNTLQHVDYWTGNILWNDGHISAVLDWEETACGDPGADVGYASMDLFMLGLERVVPTFLEAYEAEHGTPIKNLALWQLAAAARAMHTSSMSLDQSQQSGRFAAFLEDSFHRV